MAVDLTPLRNAVARLAEGLAEDRAEPSKALLRDGLIRRFVFTYDLAPKILRRVLASRSDTPTDIADMSFPTLMRTAFAHGLVDESWTKWLDYREKRNITSHAYDEDRAKQVAAAIPAFLVEVTALLDNLERYGAA